MWRCAGLLRALPFTLVPFLRTCCALRSALVDRRAKEFGVLGPGHRSGWSHHRLCVWLSSFGIGMKFEFIFIFLFSGIRLAMSTRARGKLRRTPHWMHLPTGTVTYRYTGVNVTNIAKGVDVSTITRFGGQQQQL